MRKKAQTEIVGLIVIVVLFIVILMVYVSFSLKPKARENLKENIQVDYMMDAILKYTPSCQGVVKSMREIIRQCDFEVNSNICGRPCKDMIREESSNIISLAYDANKKAYSYGFEVKQTKNNQEKVLEIAKCSSNTVMSDTQNIYGGSEAILTICVL